MKRTIQVSVRRGESKYVAECIGLPVVTQADTLGELARNISEAIALFLEDEDLSEFQLAPQPVVVATLELDLAACSASDQAVAMSGRTPGGVESHFACPRLTPGALGDPIPLTPTSTGTQFGIAAPGQSRLLSDSIRMT